MAWAPTFVKSLCSSLGAGICNTRVWLNRSPRPTLTNKHVVAAATAVVGSMALGAEAFARADMGLRCGKTLEDRVDATENRLQNNSHSIALLDQHRRRAAARLDTTTYNVFDLQPRVAKLEALQDNAEPVPATSKDIEKRVDYLEGAVEMFVECVQLMTAELDTLQQQQTVVKRQQYQLDKFVANARA